MQKQRIILITSIVLAFMAVIMGKMYLDQQRQEMQKKAREAVRNTLENSSPVLIASKDIPQGVMLSEDYLTSVVLPKQSLEPQVVNSLSRVDGMMAITPIPKGQQITLNKLTNTRTAGDLAAVTPVGKRAVAIAVDSLASVGGMVQAGDYVDVIGIVPVPVQTADGKTEKGTTVIPLFQNVLVLSVGRETTAATDQAASATGGRYRRTSEESKEKQETKGVPIITLALAPLEANFLTFVQEQAKLHLLLRSPADAQVQPFQAANWDSLFRYIMPPEPPKPAPPPEPPKDYVEIYRGLQKERVELLK